MVEIQYVEGNEELLGDIIPLLKDILKNEYEDIIKELQEKAKWGSMRIVIAKDHDEVYGIGIATVNNLNTGHVEYILVDGKHKDSEITTILLDKLTGWLRWLKVKSVSIDRENMYW